MIAAPLQRVAEEVRREIEHSLNSIGLLSRVFGRGKSEQSINRKINNSPGRYAIGGRLLQDAVGIRVVVYFPDDIEIIDRVLRSQYVCDHQASSIDTPSADVFSVTRHNLIFSLPSTWHTELKYLQKNTPIDSTFEVQLRTILSEGWHEVEHDLRYKRKDDWEHHNDLSRHLNGVVATLETSEWSMKKIFEDLAYRHYKNGKWDAMLHSVFRMRVTTGISEEMSKILDSDQNLCKEILRLNRATLFMKLNDLAPKIPLTIDNLLFLWNHYRYGSFQIKSITPEVLLDNFSENLKDA